MRSQLAAFVTLILVCSVAVYALGQRQADALRNAQAEASSTIWHSQLNACARGNKVRATISQSNATLKILLLGQAGTVTPDLRAHYLELAEQIHDEPPVDCARAYPKP